MSKFVYHGKTFAMLGVAPAAVDTPAVLTDIARDHAISLPASYAELCKAEGANELLHRYSNTDSFFLHRPEVLPFPKVGPLLHFMSESQGNFELAVSCGEGDDPPVYFRDYNHTRWITYCQTFSDAVYTQVFDWQFVLRQFGNVWDRDYVLLECPFAPAVLDSLSRRAKPEPTTHWFMDDQEGATYRYSLSADRRAKIEVCGGMAAIEVTGRTSEDKSQAANDVKRYLKEEAGLDLK